MKKLLLILVLLSAGLCWYVTRPETIKAPASATFKEWETMTEMPSSSSLVAKIPRPLRLIYKAACLKEIAQGAIPKENWTPLSKMPPALPKALVAIEDRRFYSHHGIDPDGIMRATLVNIQENEVVEGGSTLTQQLVKNTLLTSERSMGRKLWEAVLALIVEARYTKEEILEMYLNTTFFGNNSVGVRQAARGYFGVEPLQLSLDECAVIAGLPNAPTALNPYLDRKACKERRDLVLTKMQEEGYIDKGQMERAHKKKIVLAHE
jgi:membrane peptidoglycan carboxypeptidase